MGDTIGIAVNPDDPEGQAILKQLDPLVMADAIDTATRAGLLRKDLGQLAQAEANHNQEEIERYRAYVRLDDRFLRKDILEMAITLPEKDREQFRTELLKHYDLKMDPNPAPDGSTILYTQDLDQKQPQVGIYVPRPVRNSQEKTMK